MEGMQTIDDVEIQEKVESLAGKGVRVIDCEKSSSYKSEEVLLINGYPVPLQGEEGKRIKAALITGQVPPCELLNDILLRAGILKNPVELETTLNVKSTTKTTELVTLRDKDGVLVDERMKEVEEDNEFNSSSTEVWKKEDKQDESSLRGLGKQFEKITLPSTSASSYLRRNGSPFNGGGGGSGAGTSSTYQYTHTPPSTHSSYAYSSPYTSGIGSNPNRFGKHSSSSPQPPFHFSNYSSSPSYNNNNSTFSSPSPEASSSRSPSSSSYSYSPRFSPSIFGTVASTPDSTTHQRKHLPQTPITGNGSSSAIQPPSTCGSSRENAPHQHHQLHNGGSNSLSSFPSSSGEDSSSASSESSCSKNGPSSLNGITPNANPSSTTITTTGGGSKSGGSNLLHSTENNWDDNALVFEDTNLVSGSLDALIQHLIPTETYYPDRAYIFAFLLSSRLYIKPHELLGLVFRLASANIIQPSSKYHSPKEIKIIAHVVQLLGEWAELFPYDFRDERMMSHVRNITQKCVVVDPMIRKEVSQLLSSLLARLTALERYEDFLNRINTEAALAEPLTAPSILTICPNPAMTAQQLTHIELERLSHIGPEEFVQAFAKDNAQIDAKYKDMKKTRNLESYVQWFNRLSYYVATEICKMPKKKSRVRVIEYWIETARECFNIGNFNSLMAIIAGLNMSPVSRLKKTWHKVCSQQLSILEHQMDPSANFTSYRSTLKAAVWRSAGATDERQKIVIPFFSLLVKDLYFLNEGCASKLTNGQINFDKFWQLAKQVSEVMAWQQISCPFPKVQGVLNSLQTAPILNENALCLASYECESADNAQEKERLKYLRQEGSNNKKSFQNTSPSNAYSNSTTTSNSTGKDKDEVVKSS